MPLTSALPTLRFVTCGSVDDGKSTLIGRLLHETQGIFDDELQALAADSKHHGTQGELIDFALLMDGLQAEREQGITIDVAYRYFSTARRRFIVADTPGHEQYTRNTATGASTAQVAVVLVDARKGVLTQTRRHTRILSIMDIRHAVLVVNKMDLVGYEQAVFEAIADSYAKFAAECGLPSVQAIPVSALEGVNITHSSTVTPWYSGLTLLEHLESVDTSDGADSRDFRLPVQWINRPHADFRGVCGRVTAGTVSPGDRVTVLPSGVETCVGRIVGWELDQPCATAGECVTLTLADDVDVSRGDVIAAVDRPPASSDQFEARVLWMGAKPLMPGRAYVLKLHCKEVTATITAIKYREDVDSGAHLAADILACNDIGVVTISTAQLVVFEPYRTSRSLGAFILIDKLTFDTVGAGMLNFALRRASTIQWQALAVTRERRAMQKSQQPRCIWFTGLSGAGKSAIANALEQRLYAQGRHTYLLDGDNVRHGLNRDLGFTEANRVENIRRVAEVAQLMVDAGLIVLVSFISPFRAERRMARALFREEDFVEVFVDAPLAVCEQRDVKGLYARARNGEIPHFTGIDSIYERPERAEVHLHSAEQSVDECVGLVMERLG